jgi:autotransporter-associated beta strand protein
VGLRVRWVRPVGLWAIVAGGVLAGAIGPASAQSATWKSNPGSNDFNAGANWSGGTVPAGTASFGSSNTTDLALSGDATLGALRFKAGAPAYTINVGGNVLRLTGVGIVNNSANAPIINACCGVLEFRNAATAANAVINSTGGAVGFFGDSSAGSAAITTSSGVVEFRGSSNAGNAAITVTNFGGLLFSANSSAGQSTIVLNNGSGGFFLGHADAGRANITLKNVSSLAFAGEADAGDATITVRSGSGLGFFGNSTADNATIHAASMGTVLFFQHGTGGTARFISDKHSLIDFSGSAGQNGVVTAGSIEGAGVVLIGNNFQVGGNNLSTEFSGQISECGCVHGALTKVGTGTLLLSGHNTYRGATTVSGGTLQVDGTIAKSSVVRVEDGGTLSGNGSVSNVVVKSGGTLAPGGGLGTLTVKGDLTFKDGSTYAVDVTANAADRTKVTGTANLNGTVLANVFGGQYVTRQFTILSATGGRTGQFDNLDLMGFTGFNGSLRYTSTDVILNLTAALGGGGQQLSGNQQNISTTVNDYFNGGGKLPAGFVNLFALKGPALGKALTQLTGEVATAAPTAGFQSMNIFLNAMLNPFAGDSAAPRAFAQAMSPQAGAASAYAMAPSVGWPQVEKRWSSWVMPYGGRSYLDGDPSGTGSHSVQAGTYGVIAGADYRAADDTWLGVAMAGGGNSWDLSNGLGNGDADSFQLGAYGIKAFGAAYVAGSLGFGWHHVKTDRTVTVAGTDKLVASFDAQNLGARLEGGYRLPTALGTVTPYAAVQAQSYWLPAYDESASSGAATFALNYQADTVQSLRTELGSWFETSYRVTDTGLLALRGRVAWVHEANDDARLTATFQTLPGASFMVTGADAPSDSALLTGAAELRLPDNLTLSVRLDGEFAGSGQTYAATAQLRKAW